jgi:hypothetical protein
MHRMLLVYRLNNLRAGDLKGESLCFDTAWLASTPGASSVAGSLEVCLSGVPPFVREKMFQESDIDLFKPESEPVKQAEDQRHAQKNERSDSRAF